MHLNYSPHSNRCVGGFWHQGPSYLQYVSGQPERERKRVKESESEKIRERESEREKIREREREREREGGGGGLVWKGLRLGSGIQGKYYCSTCF